ncbi:MAG: AraC family transcriptional regulator [Bacteroidales bacterium]|nr:AraC family transcriptional regulator [Bacteroidales bacterium]
MKEKKGHTGEFAIRRALRKYVRKKLFLVPSSVSGTLGRELGLDSKALHNYLMRAKGCDAAQWRTGLRVEWAKQLLIADPGALLSEIAARSGFSDRSNFSRQFLAHTGLTPAKWREQKKTIAES